jgi:creatinine amidohydrolase
MLMEEMTWHEMQDAIKNKIPVVVPIGALEQHGPHLPIGTDALIAFELAKHIARERRLIVAPPVYYAAYSRPKSGGGRSFPGSTGIRGHTLVQVIQEVTEDLLRQGVERLVILNGHYENAPFVCDALEAAIPASSVHARKALLMNWWDFIRSDDMAWLFGHGFPGWEAEHAGHCETSLLEALRPRLVRTELKIDDRAGRVPPYDIFPPPSDIIAPSGVLARSTAASGELGARLLDVLVERMKAALAVEFPIEAHPET